MWMSWLLASLQPPDGDWLSDEPAVWLERWDFQRHPCPPGRGEGIADTQMANDFTDHACVVSLCRNLKGRDPEKLPGQGQVGCWEGGWRAGSSTCSPVILPSHLFAWHSWAVPVIASEDTAFLAAGCFSKLGGRFPWSNSENKIFSKRRKGEFSWPHCTWKFLSACAKAQVLTHFYLDKN